MLLSATSTGHVLKFVIQRDNNLSNMNSIHYINYLFRIYCMGCRMTKRKRAMKNVQTGEDHIERLPEDLDTMKRKDLQKLCKTYKLKAIGKVR